MRPKTVNMTRARGSRRALTPPEVALWSQIKGRKLEGLHFRRQHPAGPFILDFYCPSARLAIEVDGMGHGMGDRPQRDARRDAWLQAKGIATLRIVASSLRGDLSPVLLTILGEVRRLAPSTPSGSPSPANAVED